MTNNAFEVFEVLFNKGICTELADFYENYAWELEKVNNNKKADAIFQEGLNRGAQPIENLVLAHR